MKHQNKQKMNGKSSKSEKQVVGLSFENGMTRVFTIVKNKIKSDTPDFEALLKQSLREK